MQFVCQCSCTLEHFFDDEEKPEAASLALQRTLSDLRTAVASFNSVYERCVPVFPVSQSICSELRPWTHQPAPSLIGVGPASSRVLQLHRTVFEVIQSLADIHSAMETLENSTNTCV